MWTKTWPKEPGKYWYYGWCYWSRKHSPELHFVKVRRTVDYKMVYITNGGFIYPEDRGYGMWQLADLPDLPEL